MPPRNKDIRNTFDYSRLSYAYVQGNVLFVCSVLCNDTIIHSLKRYNTNCESDVGVVVQLTT